MNKERLAEILNGREYRDEMSPEQKDAARAAGLIVIFGYSDDNVLIEGVISEEVGAYNGTEFYIRNNEFIKKYDLLEEIKDVDGYEDYLKSLIEKDLENTKPIKAKYDVEGYTWFITSNIPLAEFDIFEDGEKFCRGIIIDSKDL